MNNTFQNLIDISLETKENADDSKLDPDDKFSKKFSSYLTKKESLSIEADQNVLFRQDEQNPLTEGTIYTGSFITNSNSN